MSDHDPADLLGERLDPLLQRVALIGESEFRAMLMRRPGDAPGDGTVVRDPHDEAALAAHQSRGVRHAYPSGAAPLAAAASYDIGLSGQQADPSGPQKG